MGNGVTYTMEQALKNHAIAAALAKQDRARTVTVKPLDQLEDASEENVVSEICEALWFMGFSTPQAELKIDARKPGPGYYQRVGQHRADQAGSDSGVPDLLVYITGMPFALTFEVKERKRGKRGGWIGGRKQPEQELLESKGCIRVVRSAAEVVEAVRCAMRVFSGNNGALLKAALERKA